MANKFAQEVVYVDVGSLLNLHEIVHAVANKKVCSFLQSESRIFDHRFPVFQIRLPSYSIYETNELSEVRRTLQNQNVIKRPIFKMASSGMI